MSKGLDYQQVYYSLYSANLDRGTCSSKNLKTDFNWGQETLPYTFISGADKQPEFKLNISKVLDTEAGKRGKCSVIRNEEATSHTLIEEADNILRNTILMQAFPCVHSGFIEVYNLVRDEIMDTVIKVFKRQIEKALQRCLENESNEGENPFILPKIYVTGVSRSVSYSHISISILKTKIFLFSIPWEGLLRSCFH